MTRLKERKPAMEKLETVEQVKREPKPVKLMNEEVSGIAVSMIKPRPESDPGIVEIHVSGASAESSPFIVRLEDGWRVFLEIVDQLKADATGDLDKLIRRAKQAVYSKKRDLEKQLQH